jgi:heme/copper-type cytochrome/quinol oxidase subunit 3
MLAARRPPWMTAMAALCAFGTAFLVYRDLAIPEVRDVEVWLGVELRGSAARATAPLHWAILATGAWGFFTQRRWIALATALYLHYVALSHLIWSEASARGRGWEMGVLQAAFFSALAIPFWRAHRAARAR